MTLLQGLTHDYVSSVARRRRKGQARPLAMLEAVDDVLEGALGVRALGDYQRRQLAQRVAAERGARELIARIKARKAAKKPPCPDPELERIAELKKKIDGSQG